MNSLARSVPTIIDILHSIILCNHSSDYTVLPIGVAGLQIQGGCKISARLSKAIWRDVIKFPEFPIGLAGKFPECSKKGLQPPPCHTLSYAYDSAIAGNLVLSLIYLNYGYFLQCNLCFPLFRNEL